MLTKAKTYNYNSARFERVIVLLDSGSQNSFISTTSARRLGLNISDNKLRTFSTFGGWTTTEFSGITEVTLVDSFDKELVVELITKKVITLVQRPPRLRQDDLDFIRHLGLSSPSYQDKCVVPDILIGIDHYWDIISPEAPLCLPSGMVLCHTRFGTVVSGNSVFQQDSRGSSTSLI